MEPFHWVLAAAGAAIITALAGLLVFDVLAMLWGWRSLSAILGRIHRLWVFVIGLAWGLVLGVRAGHLWPIVGP